MNNLTHGIDVGQLPVEVTLKSLSEEYGILEIRHPLAEAKVALNGGHILSWRPAHTSVDVLYVSSTTKYEVGKAVRGGVPVCWPWFNAHATDRGLPSHGLVRNRPWKLVRTSSDESGVELVLSIDWKDIPSELTRDLPALAVELNIHVGEELKFKLITTNISSEASFYEEALHTYFKVADVREVQCPELLSTTYWDTVGEPCFREQTEPFTVQGEVDRQYKAPEVVSIVDPKGQRVISITKYGSAESVVWNPWAEKAQGLADLPDDGYLQFLCVETANTRLSPVHLQPGESHITGNTISVKAIA